MLAVYELGLRALECLGTEEYKYFGLGSLRKKAGLEP